MGYDMQVSGQLTIPKEMRAGALAAILAKHDDTSGVVTWVGEDDEQGRYFFANGQVEEQGGRVIFGMSYQLADKLQGEIDRDTAVMLGASQEEVAADA